MSAYEKTILCLANSRRPGGTCFAGKEFANGNTSAWIRPINAAHNGAISGQDRIYKDSSHADLLDIVKVRLVEAKPHLHHKEDHQIDAAQYWEKIGRATWEDVVKATDVVKGALWVNDSSSQHGLNDKVREASAEKLSGSLTLIQPEKLEIVVAKESGFNGPDVRKVRANFTYNGIPYNFVVTDAPFEHSCYEKGDGIYPIADSRLCVSLAEILSGFAIKLVAAVITPSRI